MNRVLFTGLCAGSAALAVAVSGAAASFVVSSGSWLLIGLAVLAVIVGMVFVGVRLGGGWVIMLIVSALGFTLGLLPAQAVAGGPGVMLALGLFTAFLYAALSYWLGLMTFDMEWDESLTTVKKSILAACISFMMTFYPVAYTIDNGHQHAVYLRSMAVPTQEFGTGRFAAIDTDDNGVLTTEEMDAADRSLSLNERERQLLQHMNSQRSEIGHEIGSNTTYVWISTGKGGYLSPIIVSIYGISAPDLNSYPARLTEKWKRW